MKNWLPLSLFIIALLVIFPRNFYIPPDGITVDDGRNFALAFFTEHRAEYAWGKDVIYTYGPLGVLSTRWFPSSYILPQLLVDLYIIFCLVLAFGWVKRTGTRDELCLLSLSLLVSMWEINMLLQLVNLIFLVIIYRDKKASWLAFLVVISSIFLIYVKLNTLIVTIPILVLTGVLTWNRGITVFGLVALFACLNVCLSSALNVSPAEYFRTAIDTVTDHAYAMYMWKPDAEAPFHMAILFSGIVCAALLYTILADRKLIKLLLIGTIALFYFVLFKEGFVRADMGHYMQYFRFLPLVFFCIYMLVSHRKRLFAVAIVLFALFVMTDGYNEGVPLFSGETPVFTYLRQFINDDPYTNTVSGGGSADYLNNSCLNGIGKNWHPRPAFQSMIAISPRIDSINAAYYLSDRAPDTVFYDNKSLDDLNPMWDDPQLKQALISKYDLIAEFHNVSTLVKRKKPSGLSYIQLADTVIGFGQSLPIPPGADEMKAEVSYTWSGRLRGIVWQPPHIIVKFDQFNFRYISPLHNSQYLMIDPSFKTLNFNTDMPSGVIDLTRVSFYKTQVQ
jgi:hypothetical protein